MTCWSGSQSILHRQVNRGLRRSRRPTYLLRQRTLGRQAFFLTGKPPHGRRSAPALREPPRSRPEPLLEAGSAAVARDAGSAYRPVLDIVRFLAALWVMLSHAHAVQGGRMRWPSFSCCRAI